MAVSSSSATGKYSRDVVSPSLLQRIALSNKPLNPNFDLGMNDWMDPPPNIVLHNKENSDSTDAAPPSKRKKLSLAKPIKERFSDTVSNEELDKMSLGFVPENTAKSTKWATNVFSSWLESRNHRTGESTPMDYLDGPFSTEASKVELA